MGRRTSWSPYPNYYFLEVGITHIWHKEYKKYNRWLGIVQLKEYPSHKQGDFEDYNYGSLS